MEKNEHYDRIRRGLTAFDKVFNKNHLNYRVLGSVLVAAINGKPHRTLGDIDMVIDEKDFMFIKDALEKEGFVFVQKRKYDFSWYEANRPDSLGYTFLMVGKFKDNYFSLMITKNIELRIADDYLKKTKYSLLGVEFMGIPGRSVYEGLKISSLNPKRKLDREVVKEKFGGKIPEGIMLGKAFRIFVYGIEIPGAYELFSKIYNLFGAVRVVFGKKYEVWE